MAITQQRKRKNDMAVAAIRDSGLDPAFKEDLVDVLCRTLEATNGMTPEQKLQACTENQHDMMRLYVMQILAYGKHPTNWKDVLVKCRREAMFAIFAVAALVALRPQIAEVVEQVLHATRGM